eukprot:15001905-Alexandrium_andersonii.AAC.1
MVKALKLVAKDKDFRELKDAKVLEDWAVRMALRVRAQGRAINQAEHKHPEAAWLKLLWGTGDDDSSEVPALETPTSENA